LGFVMVSAFVVFIVSVGAMFGPDSDLTASPRDILTREDSSP
jgi:hypothetical protein